MTTFFIGFAVGVISTLIISVICVYQASKDVKGMRDRHFGDQ